MVQTGAPGWNAGDSAWPVVDPPDTRDHRALAQTGAACVPEALVGKVDRRYAGQAGDRAARSPAHKETPWARVEASSGSKSQEILERGAVCAQQGDAQRA